MPLLDLFWAIVLFALFFGFIWLIFVAIRALVRVSHRRGGGWKAWAIAAGVVMVLVPPVGLLMAGAIVLVDWAQWRAWAITAGVLMVLVPPVGLPMAGVIVLLDRSQRRTLNVAEPTPIPPPPPQEHEQVDVPDELAAECRSAHRSGRYVGSRWVCDDHQTPWCPQCMRHHREDRGKADPPQHANDAAESSRHRLPPTAA